MNVCNDMDLRSNSVRAGDGRADWFRCGAPATHYNGVSYVCAHHHRLRAERGDLMSAWQATPSESKSDGS